MEKVVPNMKKAMEEREENPKVPSRDPDLSELVAGEQPQLQREHHPPNISEMKPMAAGCTPTRGPARGGGRPGCAPAPRRAPTGRRRPWPTGPSPATRRRRPPATATSPDSPTSSRALLLVHGCVRVFCLLAVSGTSCRYDAFITLAGERE
jgi:hypothetical protein